MVAVAACIILALLAVFQLALVVGAPIGRFAWGGQAEILPVRLRIGSVVSIVTYAVIAAILLQKAGVIHVVDAPDAVQVAAWVVFAFFVLGVLTNAVSRSKEERYTMVPVTLVLAALSLTVALV